MALDTVGADACQDRTQVSDSFMVITEAAGFDASAAGEVAYVEVQHHVPVSKPIGQVEDLFEVGGAGEVGG